LLLGCVLVLLTTACASRRPVSIGSDVTYPVEVVNQLSQSMTVYWSDGGEPRLLGPVGAGRTERFLIVGSGSTSVSITARDAGGAQRAGPISVVLEAGVTKRVIVR
jgi:hypothetical protein